MVLCNILLSGGRDTGSYIPRMIRGHLPSTLDIESLNAVATKTTRAYLYGIQDNLLDFRDRARLTGRTRTDGRAMSSKIPPKLRPGLTPGLDAVSVVRNSRRNVGPTCRPTEAVHCARSGRVRGRESERGPLTLLSSEASGSIQADSRSRSHTGSVFSFKNPRPLSSKSLNNPSPPKRINHGYTCVILQRKFSTRS